jgi:hypothetical protein
MNSPITGKPMERRERPETLEFKGEHFLIKFIYYYCPSSQTAYTDVETDTINLNQVYIQYSQKYNIPFEQVIQNI